MACTPLRKRAGFSLLEVLVSIAIIGILLALILPAVQTAQASARRVQSQNNLRQLGVAFHNYESVHRSLPLGGSRACQCCRMSPAVPGC